jgi:hypothetical protein
MSTGKSHRLTLPPVIGELLQRELTLLFGKRAILDLKSLSTEAFYLHVAKQRGHLLSPVQTPKDIGITFWFSKALTFSVKKAVERHNSSPPKGTYSKEQNALSNISRPILDLCRYLSQALNGPKISEKGNGLFSFQKTGTAFSALFIQVKGNRQGESTCFEFEIASKTKEGSPRAIVLIPQQLLSICEEALQD